ncbi:MULTISPECIES: sunset domain-containing protein [unclassified Saccharothrix]|uniref:sunset domain-containing protein n=1 Tax=unclassified Saccharothrix TaxID=2593673 RepID=UPI00307CDEA1
MSSLFGQVWLWSLLSFVAGVALTWLVLVRPAKKELQDVEDRLLGASPRPVAPAVAASAPVAPVAHRPAEPVRDEFDDWHRSSSPVDDLLRDDDPPRYDVANMKLDERDRLLEELDDEHRPLSDFEEQHDFPEYEDDRPRSLFERLSPGAEPAPAGSGPAPFAGSGPSDEPEDLPAEEAHLLPPAQPAAEVAVSREPEPTAPPEVEAFQPREVWREEPEQVVYGEDEDPAEGPEQEDEPERPAEQTTLIPATALARAIAEVDARDEENAQQESAQQESARRDEPRQLWPDRDLTGEYPVIRAELPTPEPDLPAAESTTVLDARAIAAHTPAADQRRPEPQPDPEPRADTTPEPAGDQPFVPTYQPEPAAHSEPEQPFVPTYQPEPAAHAKPEPLAQREPRAQADPREPFTEAEPAAQREPQPFAQPQPAPQPQSEPARPRSLFEPVVTPDDEAQDEPPAPPKPRPATPGNDQPFVPKLAPELLETKDSGGLPQRPVRPAGARTTPPLPPTPAPQPLTPPPPPRPARPRPVGFSPSTGGRPGGATTRYQQPEGFNPRSPFGPGSVLPKSDGKAPAPDFQVKATLTGRRYFTAESANFSETRADVWFRTTSDAEKAGFRPAP